MTSFFEPQADMGPARRISFLGSLARVVQGHLVEREEGSAWGIVYVKAVYTARAGPGSRREADYEMRSGSSARVRSALGRWLSLAGTASCGSLAGSGPFRRTIACERTIIIRSTSSMHSAFGSEYIECSRHDHA